MKYICIIILLSCFFYIWIIPIQAEEKRETDLNAQEILARVDKMIEYPKGRLTGKMIHVTPDGSSRFIKIWGAVAGEDILFKFSSSDRGEEVKVLYNHKGKNIWVYDVHANKLFNKRELDKFDYIMLTNYNFFDLSHGSLKITILQKYPEKHLIKGIIVTLYNQKYLGHDVHANKLFNKRELDKFDYIMLTNYNFFDLSHGSLENNYTAKISRKTLIKGNDCYHLILEPVLSGGIYGLLELYVTTKDFIPIRIDFHDNEKIVFKTMSIVKTALRNEKITPVRYDMMDIQKRTVTMLEFFNFEENIKFEKKIFMNKNLWEN